MASITADLKLIRQQVERAQVEVAGRQSIGAMVVWDEQNQSSVNSESSRRQEDFNGLIVHLTPDLSPAVGTTDGVSQTEFERIRQQLARGLSR